MSYNGSGTFSLPAGNPVTTNTTISSSVHNNTLAEIATGLSTAITKDGQTTITANLPMATYRHTGVGNPTARTQYATAAGCQDNTYTYLTSVAGTNTITATAALSMATNGAGLYATGQEFIFTPAGANTGATTLNVNSIGAKNIYVRGAACAGGELIAGVPVHVVYDGTQWNAITYQDNAYTYLTGVAGTDTITATAASSTPVYITGQAFLLIPAVSNTGATTLNVNSIGAKDVFVRGAACVGGELIAGVPVQVVYDGTRFHAITFSGFVQKVEATPYTTYASASTALPNDDSIPQSGEGTEILTAAITPKSTLHRLVIEAVAHMSGDASRTCIAALFQDATANALAVAVETSPAAGNVMTIRLRHEMAAGTTSATTFKIRVGTTAGSYYINGNTSSRSFGGIMACTLSVSEFA